MWSGCWQPVQKVHGSTCHSRRARAHGEPSHHTDAQHELGIALGIALSSWVLCTVSESLLNSGVAAPPKPGHCTPATVRREPYLPVRTF